jgi:hypothetical protein
MNKSESSLAVYREAIQLALRHLEDQDNEFPYALAHLLKPGSPEDQDRDFLVRVLKHALHNGEGERAQAHLQRLQDRVDQLEMALEARYDY